MLIEAAGTTVAATRRGEGPTRVLLLHGWGASQKLLLPVAEQLHEFDTLTIDFPGFGESGRPPEPWGVPEYAACVREVLQKERFAPCAVIAHSFGCRVAVQLAADDPALFTRLMLTGAAGIKKQPTAEQQRRTARFKQLKRMAALLEKTPLKPLGARWQNALRQKYGSADYNALDEEMRQTFVKVVNLDLKDRLPEIQQPTLLVFGDRDTETPLWMGETMEKLIPDAGLVTLAGGTHFAYLEQLGSFVKIARHFLTEG